MATLADEILALLPELVQPYSKGLTAKEIAAHLSCTEANAHTAFDSIRDERRAQIVRHKERGALRRIVPLDHDFGLPGLKAKACWKCEALYSSQNQLYCSKKCSASHRWTLPGYKERVGAAISAAHHSPEQQARTAAHNKKRWSKPGEREKMAEQNRREWADPVKRAKRSASIQAAHGTPENRKFYSDLRKANWSDPEYYRMMQAKMIAAKNTPEFRAKFSEGLKNRWQDPEMRPKFMAAVKRNSALAADRARKQWADPEKRPALLAAQRESAKKARATRLAAPVSEFSQSVFDIILSSTAPLTASNIESSLNAACNPVRNALRVLERHGLVCRQECTAALQRKSRKSHPKFVWVAVRQKQAKRA